MSVAASDISHWREWIGRTENREERLDKEASRRLAAALGERLDVEVRQPSLGHWAFFLPVVGADQVGADGHPKRGGLLPPISLERRMFAAAEIDFAGPLQLDAPATRVSTVTDVAHKHGRSGDLVLVQVTHLIQQGGADRVHERQTLVYRNRGEAVAAIEQVDALPVSGEHLWEPSTADLFRFSAATFNGHRIHYDRDYATKEEGYPALVVQGPYIAARLFCLLSGEECPGRFAFRAIAPIFSGQPVRLRRDPDGLTARAVRCDGTVAMEATIETSGAKR